MTKEELNQPGKTLRDIADQLRGAMNADDFRDYMLSFLFLRYLSDSYKITVEKWVFTIQAQKIAAINIHKQGLMQQLFPVMDEVSA